MKRKAKSRADLLILDDFGILKMKNNDRLCFLEIIEDRGGKAATIVISQHPVILTDYFTARL